MNESGCSSPSYRINALNCCRFPLRAVLPATFFPKCIAAWSRPSDLAMHSWCRSAAKCSTTCCCAAYYEGVASAFCARILVSAAASARHGEHRVRGGTRYVTIASESNGLMCMHFVLVPSTGLLRYCYSHPSQANRIRDTRATASGVQGSVENLPPCDITNAPKAKPEQNRGRGK